MTGRRDDLTRAGPATAGTGPDAGAMAPEPPTDRALVEWSVSLVRFWSELVEDLRSSELPDTHRLVLVEGLGGELCEALRRWLERRSDGG